MERYARGVVGLDDAADYFYKRLHPLSYRLLKHEPSYRQRRRHHVVRYGWKSLAAQLLLPLVALHYRKCTDRYAGLLRANRRPDAR